MMVQGVSISEMLNQSTTVLTKPSVQSFEQFEKHGGTREAIVYIVVAAALAGIAGLVFGLLGGISGAIIGLLGGIVRPLLSFFVFAYVLYFVGKQQGGTWACINGVMRSMQFPSTGGARTRAEFDIGI